MTAIGSVPLLEQPNGEARRPSSMRLARHSRDSQKSAPPQLHASRDQSDQEDPFLVRFEENDPTNPRNFSSLHKACLTLLLGLLAVVGSFGSSVVTPASGALSRYFKISSDASALTISLYVLGFAVGPCIWAPLSEVYGRKWSMLPALSILALFSIGTATSTNAVSVFITRFFGGVFASAPISNVSAALGDLYQPEKRGTPVAFYTLCVSGGAMIGPLVGSALTVNQHLGWRWTEYIEAMIAGVLVIISLFLLPELYAPVILKRKALRLRTQTGDNRYWHPHEKEKVTPGNVIVKYFSRPLRMLLTEPIVTCIALYASFVYGLSYLFLVVVQIVFEEHRHWSLIVSTLPFLAVLVGIIAAMCVNLANQPIYAKAVARNQGRAAPEARLPPMIIGGVLFVAGMFWFGWTAAPQYSWVLPVIASALIGAGFNIIFQQCINYLVDVYGPYAASATAANTFLRSLAGFALPLAARPMFDNLGVPVASSVLGGIGCVALPVPFILMKYGLQLRKMSKFAPVPKD